LTQRSRTQNNQQISLSRAESAGNYRLKGKDYGFQGNLKKSFEIYFFFCFFTRARRRFLRRRGFSFQGPCGLRY
jgi:hypothetical protein